MRPSPRLTLFLSSAVAVLVLGYLDSLQYEPAGRPDYDPVEHLFMAGFAFIPAVAGVLSSGASALAGKPTWARCLTGIVVASISFNVLISAFLALGDEYLDAMEGAMVSHPLLFFFYMLVTYSIPCMLIIYGLTALIHRSLFHPPRPKC